jgi:hypothetical protein
MRPSIPVLVTVLVCLIASARAETPTTQPLNDTTAKVLGLLGSTTTPNEVDQPAPISAFKSSDLDLHFRAAVQPPVNKLKQFSGYGTLVPSIQNNLQQWSSFNYNGVTVWNRPAIYDSTVHAVRDQTTGKTFYYRDFANTVQVPQQLAPLRDQIGAYRRQSPANDLNLLDDRPKQK